MLLSILPYFCIPEYVSPPSGGGESTLGREGLPLTAGAVVDNRENRRTHRIGILMLLGVVAPALLTVFFVMVHGHPGPSGRYIRPARRRTVTTLDSVAGRREAVGI